MFSLNRSLRTRSLPPWLPAVLAAIAALAVYAVTIGGSYVFDDTLLHEDPRFTTPRLWLQFFTRDYMPMSVDKLYRPFTCMTFALQYALHGDRPWAYHLANLLLHASASAAVAELARRLINLRSACVAGVWFAVHPIHVEAVAGLVGRAELLCTLAIVLGLILFLKPMTARRAAAICVCLAIAILSKEQGVLLPAMLLALAPYRAQLLNRHSTSDNRKSERGAMHGLIAAVCFMTAGYLIFREQLLGFGWDRASLDWAINPLVRSFGRDRLLMPLALLGRYLALLVLPLRLSIDYSAQAIGWTVHWREPYVYLGAVALIGWLGAVAWAMIARRWAPFFCLVAMALSYGMVSNFPILIGTIFGERLMYLPSAFLLILIAALLDFLLRPKAFAILATLIAILGSVRAFDYAKQWNHPFALYRANLRQDPNAILLYDLVAGEYMARGEYAEARKVGREALRRLPDCWQSYAIVVKADVKLRDFADADRVLEHVDRQCPPTFIAPLQDLLRAARQREAAGAG